MVDNILFHSKPLINLINLLHCINNHTISLIIITSHSKPVYHSRNHPIVLIISIGYLSRSHSLVILSYAISYSVIS
ncbi:hypothetical protein CPT_Privateer_146 [Proteus phage Privateer]|uniref:Uncharacterized protein n=1 Tax=Proteus phage Privateer TaxID=2712958 RepID=A0A6G8R443_9CAUD|nr:hypothetical protein HWD17_gp110 [Proteus phage Privateer]QIN94936.1 hypothetical protein CPT_Privateer_146 [Proteus phage Privateer]